LIWTDQKGSIGLTKRFWYQLLGRMDDGVLSDDTVYFYETLAKLVHTSVDLGSDDRAALAMSLIELMDKENPFDPRLKSRLLEQAASS